MATLMDDSILYYIGTLPSDSKSSDFDAERTKENLIMQTLDLLKEIELFSSLSLDELKELSGITTLKTYTQGSTLFMAGDICNSVIILTDGVVSICKHDSRGNEVVIGYFHRYSLLAEAATLRRSPLPSTATFQTDGSVLKISLEGFEKFLLQHPSLSHKFILSLLDKIELLQQNIHFNLATTSKEKILNFYIRNPKLSVDLKQYEVASILGMTAETFSRNAKLLVQDGKLLKTKEGYRLIGQP